MGDLPISREPVIAQIQRGQYKWYEVVYYDANLQLWCGQHGSDTFHTNEDTILNWQYCREVLND